MANSYRVGVVNRYALFLDDESDPLDALKEREQAKELKRKTKAAKKENKVKSEIKPKGGSAEQQKPKGPSARPNERNVERPGPPRRDFGDRRPNYDRRNFNDNTEGGERRGPRPPREPRERDGPRGPRPGYDNRGKREFDRRMDSDKTGVKPVDKRDGGGTNNRGTLKDGLDELNKNGSKGKVGAGAGASAGAEPVPAGRKVVVAAPQPRELTLDEYKSIQIAQRTPQLYNLRKAGEGEDLSQWKNLVMLERKKEDSDDDDIDEVYDIADYPQRVGRQRRVQGIEFTFSDTSWRGGGRGRWRRGRWGLPREKLPPEERSTVGQQAVPPNVDDSKDFPSLG